MAAAVAQADVQKCTPEYAEKVVVTRAIETVRKIAAFNKANKANPMKGIHYANEAFLAMQAAGQEKRVEMFRQQNYFYNGLAPCTHFRQGRNEEHPNEWVSSTGFSLACFQLKAGVAAKDALDAIQEGLSFVGCGEVSQIGHWEGIHELLGTEKFNALFAADGITPFTVHCDSSYHAMSLFYVAAEGPLRPGDMVGILNVPSYIKKHIIGGGGGFVCMRVEDEKFCTLGLNPDGAIKKEVDDVLLLEFNLDPVDTKPLSKELGAKVVHALTPRERLKRKEFRHKKITREEFVQQGGGKESMRVRLRFDRLTELANATIPQAKVLLKRWRDQHIKYI